MHAFSVHVFRRLPKPNKHVCDIKAATASFLNEFAALNREQAVRGQSAVSDGFSKIDQPRVVLAYWIGSQR